MAGSFVWVVKSAYGVGPVGISVYPRQFSMVKTRENQRNSVGPSDFLLSQVTQEPRDSLWPVLSARLQQHLLLPVRDTQCFFFSNPSHVVNSITYSLFFFVCRKKNNDHSFDPQMANLGEWGSCGFLFWPSSS